MSGDLPQAFERNVTTLVLNGRFDKDMHRLPVRGHSFLPCDRNLLVVETYSEWEDVIREKFDVTSMTGIDMFDFKNHLATFFKKSVTKNGEKMSITKCKIWSFSVDYKFDIKISETMSDTVTSMFRLLKPGVLQVAYPERPLYVAQLAIKEAKLKDVEALSRYLSLVARM